jgi:arylsulfatase A-like enzyme
VWTPVTARTIIAMDAWVRIGATSVLATACLLGGATPLASGGAPAPTATYQVTAVGADPRPNIVVVMADDMRVDDLLFAPQVRRLVGRNGLTFENSFAPYPLCCPDRASFLTGQYAHNHGVFWSEHPFGYAAFDDSQTLATALHAVGYRTGFIGKYLNGYGPDRSKVSGVRSYRYVPSGWDDWRAAFENPHRGGIHGGTYDYMDTPFNVNGRVDNRYRGTYQSPVIGRFSVDMERQFARSGQPFFMYVNYVAPHFGYPNEPDDPHGIRDDNGFPHVFRTPARPNWVRGRFNGVVTRSAGMPAGGGPSEADISDKPRAFHRPEPNHAERVGLRTLTRQRAEAVYVMDQQVGRLIRQLKRSGEWDSTVLMFLSDNGYYLGEHRKLYGKIRAHEPSLRVPFLVTGPGMRTGQVRYDPISTVDVAATVVDLAGAEPPRLPDGSSRLTTMLAGDEGWTVPVLDEAAFTEGLHRDTRGFAWPRTSIGVRTPRYSLIRHRTGENELYDLRRDPLENQNVWRAKRYRHIRRELVAVWWRLRNCQGDTCRAALPPDLAAGPVAEAALGSHYWDRLVAVYGLRGSRQLHP